MHSSLFLARLLGPTIILIGIGVLTNLKFISRVGRDLFKNYALVYISGIFIFAAGLAIVLSHNLWISDWRMIITIFGWITLAKGAWFILLPRTLVKAAELYTKKIKLISFIWTIMLFVGLFLSFKGYIA